MSSHLYSQGYTELDEFMKDTMQMGTTTELVPDLNKMMPLYLYYLLCNPRYTSLSYNDWAQNCSYLPSQCSRGGLHGRGWGADINGGWRPDNRGLRSNNRRWRPDNGQTPFKSRCDDIEVTDEGITDYIQSYLIPGTARKCSHLGILAHFPQYVRLLLIISN